MDKPFHINNSCDIIKCKLIKKGVCNIYRRSAIAALYATLPIMAGYLFLGFAFGLLMSGKGFGPIWPIAMSAFIFAGSMQFVAAGLLTGVFQPLYALLLALLVNARHLFYGVSMLEKFESTSPIKPYLIFGLSDETFSVLCSAKEAEGDERKRFMFFVTLFDQLYWVLGTALGAVSGALIPFDMKGIDFAMTALFIVIVLDQWRSQPRHAPVLIGMGISLVCLLAFGPSAFILPAMLSIVTLLCALKKWISKELP